jgi:hypothetical protein
MLKIEKGTGKIWIRIGTHPETEKWRKAVKDVIFYSSCVVFCPKKV